MLRLQVNQQWHRPPASLSEWCSDCWEYRGGRIAATKTAPVETKTLRSQKCPTLCVAVSAASIQSSCLLRQTWFGVSSRFVAVRVKEADFQMEQWVNHDSIKIQVGWPTGLGNSSQAANTSREFPRQGKEVFWVNELKSVLEIGYLSIIETPFFRKGRGKKNPEKQYSKKWYKSEMQLPK